MSSLAIRLNIYAAMVSWFLAGHFETAPSLLRAVLLLGGAAIGAHMADRLDRPGGS